VEECLKLALAGSKTCRAIYKGRVFTLGFSWEFLALAVSLEHLGTVFNNQKALVLSETLGLATENS
jgi:monomeric isocitrate dehydrogenase